MSRIRKHRTTVRFVSRRLTETQRSKLQRTLAVITQDRLVVFFARLLFGDRGVA